MVWLIVQVLIETSYLGQIFPASACLSFSYIGGNDPSSSLHTHLHVEDKQPLARHALMYIFSITDFALPNPLMNHKWYLEKVLYYNLYNFFEKVIVSNMKERETKHIEHQRVWVDSNHFKSPPCKILVNVGRRERQYIECLLLWPPTLLIFQIPPFAPQKLWKVGIFISYLYMRLREAQELTQGQHLVNSRVKIWT